MSTTNTIMAASKKRSDIWKYFTINSDDESHVNCNTCSNKISRGGSNPRSYGTTGLVNHLRARHPEFIFNIQNENFKVYLKSSKNFH